MLNNLAYFTDDAPVDEQASQLVDDYSSKENVSELSSNIFDRIPPELLEQAIAEHNADFPSGQETVYNNGENFHGFIRVQLNLRRPINVLPGTRWVFFIFRPLVFHKTTPLPALFS